MKSIRPTYKESCFSAVLFRTRLNALDPKQAFRCRMRQKSLFFVFFRRNPENPTIQSPQKMV